ncbi:efflux RND transporter periplasmic adaptor subunit [Flavobacterium frigidarium]|uniref:efflux RND transporter periplasmic adaptor subunit n=1 Tax=Flavobacterium frigidarium TaxID=99286 RepID=UPI00042087B7|nr:efflux RND transporter periplasmic adaptor subunit [Flavobacterium frigidarium]
MNKYLKFSILFLTVLVVGLVVYYKTELFHNTDAHAAADEVYTCSMHPQIIKHEPGSCPICGMDLVKKVSEEQPEESQDISYLLQRTDGFVVGEFENTRLKDTAIGSLVNLPGMVTYDPNSSVTISARISGRIERMYVNRKFQAVAKGQKLFDIYSPELVTEQQNFIYLITNDAENKTIINAIKQKLALYGMTKAQINALAAAKKVNPIITIYSPANGIVDGTEKMDANAEAKMQSINTEVLGIKEGDYITKDVTIFRLLNTDKVWGVFNIIRGYASLVQLNQAIAITTELDAEEVIHAKVNFIDTQLDPNEKTNRIRVYLDNSKLKLPVGLRLEAKVTTNATAGLWLQKEAIVSLGTDKVAFVKKEKGYRAVKVKTGLERENLVQILEGVTIEDVLVSNAQYLIDSGSFIKTK